MHGIIHAELKKFVEKNHGIEAWQAILEKANLGPKIYLFTATYPDEEAVAIVTAASELTGTPAEDILEAFGLFIAPSLMNMFKALIKPEWGTMELLLNTEDTIHRVVRMKNPGAAPPKLNFEQTGPKELKLLYNSPRQMSAVGRGIITGVASHYGDTVSITETPGPGGGTELNIKIA
jgi:hypothetical protein